MKRAVLITLFISFIFFLLYGPKENDSKIVTNEEQNSVSPQNKAPVFKKDKKTTKEKATLPVEKKPVSTSKGSISKQVDKVNDEEINELKTEIEGINYLPDDVLTLISERLYEQSDYLKSIDSYFNSLDDVSHIIKFYPYTYIDRMMFNLEGIHKGYLFLKNNDDKYNVALNLELDDRSGLEINLDYKIMDKDKSIYELKFKGQNEVISYIARNTRMIIIFKKDEKLITFLAEDYLRDRVVYWGRVYKNKKSLGDIFLYPLEVKARKWFPSTYPFPKKLPAWRIDSDD